MINKSYKDIKYKKNLIKDVILRIDFNNSIEEFRTNIPKEVLNTIRSIFPITEIRDNVINHVILEKKELKKSKEILKEYIFSNSDDKVVINKNVFLISVKKYESFEKLYNDFVLIWTSIKKHISSDFIKRLGLRYINNLNFKNLDIGYDEYISKNFIPIEIKANFEFLPVKKGNTIEIQINDTKLRFNYGLANPDYPSVMTNKIFVLDFDCYYDGLLVIGEVEKRIKEYHCYIQDLFEKSITKKCKEFLNEKKYKKGC